MHIPVLLCGMLCGGAYGAAVGAIVPLLSSLLTGMPPIFPVAPAMMFELCAYGLLSGLFYHSLRRNVYLSLIGAMLGGRVVSGIANAVFMGMADKPYGFSAYSGQVLSYERTEETAAQPNTPAASAPAQPQAEPKSVSLEQAKQLALQKAGLAGRTAAAR